MPLHDVCLRCGHKKYDHSEGADYRCQKPYCPCIKFRMTTLKEYG